MKKDSTFGTDSALAQVVSVYIAGEAVGALIQTAFADKLGRVRFMQVMCVVVTIGTVIQTASVNIGMFLAGRAIAGLAVGYVTNREEEEPNP